MDEALQTFGSWCREQGCQFPRLQVAGNLPLFGNGLIAATDVPSGLDVVVVPLSMLLNQHSAEKAPFFSVAAAMSVRLSAADLPICQLAFEAVNPSSRWRPYLDTIAIPSVPLLASQPELACLRGTHLAVELGRLNRGVARLAELLRPVVAARPDLGSVGTRELRWAVAVFASRALSVLWPETGQTCGSLVPLADLLNHSGTAHVEYLTHAAEGVFSIRR